MKYLVKEIRENKILTDEKDREIYSKYQNLRDSDIFIDDKHSHRSS